MNVVPQIGNMAIDVKDAFIEEKLGQNRGCPFLGY
jgi:hypothetical protein